MDIQLNYEKIFEILPNIMGIPMKRRAGKWIANRYMDGSYSPRPDKMVCRKLDDGIQILEQGGDATTLFSWLLKYGGYKTNKDVYEALRHRSAINIIVPDKIQQHEDGLYVRGDVLDKSLSDRIMRPDNLTKWLRALFGSGNTEHALAKYRVGRATRRRPEGGYIDSTQFWYINKDGLICHDKTMVYNPDGHRDHKHCANRYNRIAMGYTNRCLFGEHLLKDKKDEERVFLVESEKTAIMCYLFFKKGIWLACGGKSYLRKSKTERDWTILADVGAWKEWNTIKPFQCPRWWESYPEYDFTETDDIGDYIEWIQKKRGFRPNA